MADERLGDPSQSNQEHLVAKHKVERPQVSLDEQVCEGGTCFLYSLL